MKFDPTISLGSIIAALSIIVALLSSTIGVLRHMTQQQEILRAIIARVAKLEAKQEKQSDAIAELASTMSGMAAKLQMVYDWVMREIDPA